MKPLLRLKPYLRPYLGLIALGAVLAIPLAALRASPVPLVKYFVDQLLVAKDPRKLYLFPMLVMGLYALNFLVRFAHYFLLRYVVIRVNQKIKNDLFDHLLGLSADYFTTQSTGALISRVSVDTQAIDGAVASINVMIREPISFIMLFCYALKLNWKLTLVCFLIFPPLAVVFSASSRHLKRYIHKMNDESARLFSAMQESFTGVRIVKLFRLEDYVRRKFHERSERYARIFLRSAAVEEASHPTVELLMACVIAAVVFFGGRSVLHGHMTSGDLMGFFVTFALLMNPLQSMNDLNIKLSQGAAACQRVFEMFDWKSRLVEDPDPVAFREFRDGIRFNDVTFAYPDSPSRKVLQHVSFNLPRGRVIALVGASGAGKSSIVSLLPRIFDVTGGAIEIDGIDIRRYALPDLRRMIAVVSQDVFLFNDTIEENIRCGKLEATAEEIREAARRAHVMDFIQKLPEGFDTVIGDRGQKLSGGERQRVSIARAFLREAPILILDEATSSLDSASERAVQTALDELMLNRTTLIIAHRLSTIRHADQILVIKDGRILEQGRHDELLELRGEYARLHQLHHA